MKEIRGIVHAIGLMIVIAFGFRLIALGQAPETKWGDIGNVAQAIVAVVAAVITYRALRVAAVSADAAKVSAEAAKVAADAAFDSSESIKRVERAYIDFSYDWNQDGKPVILSVRAQNSGKTPGTMRTFKDACVPITDVVPPGTNIENMTMELLNSIVLPGTDEFYSSELQTCALTVTSPGAFTLATYPLQDSTMYIAYGILDYVTIFGAPARSTSAVLIDTGDHSFRNVGGAEWNRAF